ncbi:molybdate ABC transporter permease subunit, partial [bacterium]|nr:molybdate ABC transporter permease subunit [bacterium]
MTPDSFWTPVVLSLEVAAISTAMCVVMGGAVAYAMSRRSFPGYALLDGVFNLPLVLPPLVTGYFLLIVFGASGPLGRLLESVGIRFPFTLGAAVLAAFVVSFPLFYRAAKLAFENVDREL